VREGIDWCCRGVKYWFLSRKCRDVPPCCGGEGLLFVSCDALFKFIGPQNLSSISVWVRVVMVILYWECYVPHIGGAFWVSW
jgi:hypothetical protein